METNESSLIPDPRSPIPDLVENRIHVVILRHPQEQDALLGTAQIAHQQLKNSVLKTGLSWPSLKRLLDREVDPKRWAVLFLGTGAKRPATGKPGTAPPLTLVDRNGQPLPDQAECLARLEGIILLDGSWAQAKALWWRNAWMLKCRRLILSPPFRSAYGKLRKEPKREALSTIEAAAFTLSTLENNSGLYEQILTPFRTMLEKAQAKKDL